MSDNPLASTPDRDAQVRARAEQLWRDAGSPQGGLDEYIERADELLRMQQAGPTGQLPNPMTQHEPVPGVVVEEASIQENLGEFPAAADLGDEGRWRETPMTRDQLRHGEDAPPERGGAP